MQLPIGINQMKGGCGIGDTPSDQRAGSSGSANSDRALNAASFSTLSFARAAMRKFIAILTARPLRIERVDSLEQREDVYCLTVPDAQCFSLANGAIVRNCDAFRYLAMAWRPRLRHTPKPSREPTGLIIPPPREPRAGEMWL
jgi:hypothetical protein